MKTIYVVVGLAVAALVAYLLFFNSSSGPGASSSSGLGASTPTMSSGLTPTNTASGLTPTYNTYIQAPTGQPSISPQTQRSIQLTEPQRQSLVSSSTLKSVKGYWP